MPLRIVLLAMALLAPLVAHDIPADVTVHVWMKPAGGKMDILVRLPLKAIRDVPFPEQQGYLDVDRLLPLLPGAAKVTLLDSLDLFENDRRVMAPAVRAVQISLAADRSFESFSTARKHFDEKPPGLADKLLWNQVLLDVHVEAPVQSERSAFALRTRFDHLASRVVTVLRFELPGSPARAYEWAGDAGVVSLDPRWDQSARRFVALGVEHILGGIDHLLFLLCLVIPVRRLRDLIGVVTAFTVAHSITLIASAYRLGPDALWFPPLIEMLIAASILYMAIENVWHGVGHARWLMAFGFGLIHGFGFSFALRETLQFAGSHLLLALLAFNVGVELGQLAVLLVMVPLLAWLFRRVSAERTVILVMSALVAHTSWHWMIERWERLAQFPWSWPVFDAAFFASLLRWLMVAMILGAATWLTLRRRPSSVTPDPPDC